MSALRAESAAPDLVAMTHTSYHSPASIPSAEPSVAVVVEPPVTALGPSVRNSHGLMRSRSSSVWKTL